MSVFQAMLMAMILGREGLQDLKVLKNASLGHVQWAIM